MIIPVNEQSVQPCFKNVLSLFVMYWIGMPYWGQGYASEAAQALIKYGFKELHLQRITGKHALFFNPASWRVLQKAGMRYDGIKQKSCV